MFIVTRDVTYNNFFYYVDFTGFFVDVLMFHPYGSNVTEIVDYNIVMTMNSQR